jgi:hypothetical protein
MWAQVVVTHATSYNVLVGNVVLYPLGVTIDMWEEITYYRPSWQIGINHKASLPMRFIGVQEGKSNKSTMLVGFSSLPHGLELLEGNIHDQYAPLNGELAVLGPHGTLIILVSPLDSRPPWGTLTKFQTLVSHYIHYLAHFVIIKPIITCEPW